HQRTAAASHHPRTGEFPATSVGALFSASAVSSRARRLAGLDRSASGCRYRPRTPHRDKRTGRSSRPQPPKETKARFQSAERPTGDACVVLALRRELHEALAPLLLEPGSCRLTGRIRWLRVHGSARFRELRSA